MVVIFILQNSHLLTLCLPTEEVFQVNGQNRVTAFLRAGVTADLDPPTKLSFQASFVSYLVTNSICKLLVDHNTTFLNKGKTKPAISFQFCRIYYSESYSIRQN